MKEKSLCGKVIERLSNQSGILIKEAIEKMEVTPPAFHHYQTNDVKLGTFIKILETFGYDMVIRPSDGMGTVRVEKEVDKCEKCVHKAVSDTVLTAKDEIWECDRQFLNETKRMYEFMKSIGALSMNVEEQDFI